MIRRTVRLGTIIALLVTIAACGVRTSDGVEIADPSDVPFGLLEPDRVPAALRPDASAVVQLFLFDPDSSVLVPVTRQVSDAAVETVVDELEAGPTDSESLLGLRSALIDIAAVDGVDVDGSTASVDFNDSFTTLGGSDQLVAIAQLVYTLTQRSAIDQLVVRVDGEIVEVPRDDGTLTSDPLTRADYASFSAP